MHSGFAVTLSSLALVIVTYRYVTLTKRLLDLQSRPSVSITPGRGREGHAHHTVIRVVNHGGGSALNLRFSLGSQDEALEKDYVHLERFLRDGQPISCLSPGETLNILVSQKAGAYSNLPRLTIEVTYQDLRGENYQQEFEVNFKTLEYIDKF